MQLYMLDVNGQSRAVEAVEGTPLLWVLRDTLELTGTKYSCGIGECGSCTVLLEDQAARACAIPIGEAVGRKITTIEGLSVNGDHPLQRAWLEVQVPQCGYCQSGQIMQATALLRANPHPTRLEIIQAMDGVLCRCGTYQRIVEAIRRVAEAGGAV